SSPSPFTSWSGSRSGSISGGSRCEPPLAPQSRLRPSFGFSGGTDGSPFRAQRRRAASAFDARGLPDQRSRTQPSSVCSCFATSGRGDEERHDRARCHRDRGRSARARAGAAKELPTSLAPPRLDPPEDGLRVELATHRALKLANARDEILAMVRSEEHTSELQSRENFVCRLLLDKK